MNPIREVVRALDRRRAADSSPSMQSVVSSGGWTSVSQGSDLSDATPLVASGSGSAGSGTQASRYDHVHPSGLATATPLTATESGSVGTGTKAAREDHRHPASEDRYYADVGGRVLGVLSTTVGADRVMVLRDGNITKTMLRVATAPTDASLICDIHLNGTSIWNSTQSGRVAIVSSAYAGSENSFDTTLVAEGDELRLDIDQVGSAVAGADLTWGVQITPALDIYAAVALETAQALTAAATNVRTAAAALATIERLGASGVDVNLGIAALETVETLTATGTTPI